MIELVVSLVSFLAGAFFYRYWAGRSEESARINEHINDIVKFSEAAQHYWLKKPVDAEEEAYLAARVRVAHAATTLLYSEIAEMYGPILPNFKDKSQELYLTATGGQFEQYKRQSDPPRAMATVDQTAELIHLLRTARLSLLTLSHMFRLNKRWTWAFWLKFGPKDSDGNSTAVKRAC
jgi:hypothetical protein